jgi:hypothetical protein
VHYLKKRRLLLPRTLHLLGEPALEVLLDLAVIIPEVLIHRGVKRGEPDFPLYYKKIDSFPVTESAECGKLIRES